jgi:hypothetical protein
MCIPDESGLRSAGVGIEIGFVCFFPMYIPEESGLRSDMVWELGLFFRDRMTGLFWISG